MTQLVQGEELPTQQACLLMLEEQAGRNLTALCTTEGHCVHAGH